MSEKEYKPFLDLILENVDLPAHKLDRVALKATRPDLRTRGGFRWAFPGHWTRDPADLGKARSDDVCPRSPGDGLSVAKTVAGMASGGYSLTTLLVVGFNDRDVVAEDENKIKVVQAKTLDVVDGLAIARRHGGEADLRGANLQGADLRGVNLRDLGTHGANELRARGAIL